MSLIPVEAFPEHLAGVRDIDNLDTLKSLIITADHFIENMDDQINELTRDAGRYRLLIKMLPYIIEKAVAANLAETAEDIIERIPVLEGFLDDLIAEGGDAI